MDNSIAILLKSGKSVFTNKDLVLLWKITNKQYLKVKTSRLVKNEQLYRLRKGVFVLDKNYNKFELANKLISPSYVSLNTILAKEGVIFQYYSQIFSVARYNRKIVIDGTVYIYQKIKDIVLYNNQGIVNEKNTSIASLERAIVDGMYLNKDISFDNINLIQFADCIKIAKIYDNRILLDRINKYSRIKEENVG